jgi:E3 ubiquitin-protein ligase UBR1
MLIPEPEKQLCRALRDLPRTFDNRYGPEARRHLQQLLFCALVGDNPEYLDILFNRHLPSKHEDWSLREAQGAVDGSEYTEAARGKPCGHIFKPGEASYRCKTCTLDDTCVLCSRCYEASDHTGHTVHITISPGNSGCCDCGDAEAWRIPVNCAIHTADSTTVEDKGKGPASVPATLVDSIRSTIGRALDYICDVISCSPEQLRLPKSEASIQADEKA